MRRISPLFSRVMVFALLFLLNGGTGRASEKWWETGHLSDYPSKRYMTALGYGQSVRSAQSDAVRSLSQQLSARIGSSYTQNRETSGLTTRRSVKDVIRIRTKTRLVHILFPRTRWVGSQNSYVAFAALDIEKETRYLRGRVRNIKRNLRALESSYESASDPFLRIRLLSEIVRTKEKAALYDREQAILSGGSPSSRFDVRRDVSRLERLLARDATFQVDLVNRCGQKDSLTRTVSHHLTQALTGEGLVGASNGKIRITGEVSARPMGRHFSRRYIYYGYHYHFTVRGPGGETWGEVARDGKAAGLTKDQARMMLTRRVSREGVRPLVKGIASRLFYQKGSHRFVALPMGNSSSGTLRRRPPSASGCGSSPAGQARSFSSREDRHHV
ncbi:MULTISPECIES: LPP20 family lipoprotein [Leptospirillum]|jgi:hypothetical protein|uniref:LPP20 family lipoprotein n=1 Tax=Leptospirillum TaxID=179 RepID=UPI0000F0CA6D|nr:MULTISPECIES: LPP20 family lipoprotein [Leptospirillum]AKS24084.1 hypothetical protein ABH19_10550 [Leptospirillum sp. Group II 'CF-1']EAY56385.1 MAG: protein of unknown function [Leptospirillum rubarum]EIJ75040.1 MAG: hypothetical protein C75L2_00370055 [Leptospirillum sp. Group II 'C75']OOH84094.1 hypothetical protein BOX30_00840 [Leptospirillum ferriphilum]